MQRVWNWLADLHFWVKWDLSKVMDHEVIWYHFFVQRLWLWECFYTHTHTHTLLSVTEHCPPWWLAGGVGMHSRISGFNCIQTERHSSPLGHRTNDSSSRAFGCFPIPIPPVLRLFLFDSAPIHPALLFRAHPDLHTMHTRNRHI